MNPVVVIPSRLAASLLPGKPLADIRGEPMSGHVGRRAGEAGVGPVVVACADREIAEAVAAAGGRAVMTRAGHASGSDRVHEALGEVDPEGRHDVVVNLQGDLPAVDPAVVAAALRPLSEPAVDIGTLVAEIVDDAERTDPGVVKAAVAFPRGGDVGRALYFSRATIPSPASGPHHHHVGIYGFRRAALDRFGALPPGRLEALERLEQLRALEAGMRIDAALVDTVPPGVDTPRDLDRVRALFADGSL